MKAGSHQPKLYRKDDAGSVAYIASLADEIVDSSVGSKNKDFFLNECRLSSS